MSRKSDDDLNNTRKRGYRMSGPPPHREVLGPSGAPRPAQPPARSPPAPSRAPLGPFNAPSSGSTLPVPRPAPPVTGRNLPKPQGPEAPRPAAIASTPPTLAPVADVSRLDALKEKPPAHDSLHVIARTALFNAFFKDIGEPGTLLDHPKGQSFTLRSDVGEGVIHLNQTLMVHLEGGGSVAHHADIVCEIENGPIIYIDILDAHSRLQDIKAAAFDALHLRKEARKHFALFCYVRGTHGGLSSEVLDAVGRDAYEYHFGVDEAHASLGIKYAALKAELQRRISPTGA